MNIEDLVNEIVKNKKTEFYKEYNNKVSQAKTLLTKMYPRLMDALDYSYNVEWFIDLHSSISDTFYFNRFSFLENYIFDFYLYIINKKLDSYVVILVNDESIKILDKVEIRKIEIQKLSKNKIQHVNEIYEPFKLIDEDKLIIEIGKILFNIDTKIMIINHNKD